MPGQEESTSTTTTAVTTVNKDGSSNTETHSETGTGEEHSTATQEQATTTKEAGEEGDKGGSGDEGSSTETSAAGSQKDKPQPWFQKRINTLTARNTALQRQLEEVLIKGTQPADKTVTPAAGTTPPASPAKTTIDPEVMRLATQIVQTEQFNEKCNNLVTDGNAKFADFDVALTNMQAVGAVGPGADPGFISAVLELKDPTKIFHVLGTDPDEAARILALSPTRRVIELTRLEQKLAKPVTPKISKAPAPITPIGGAAKGEPDLADKDLPMDKWLEQRDKTRRTRQ